MSDNELQALRQRYADWMDDRAILSERDSDPEYIVSSNEWENSDDAAVDLLHQAMDVLDKLTTIQDLLTIPEGTASPAALPPSGRIHTVKATDNTLNVIERVLEENSHPFPEGRDEHDEVLDIVKGWRAR